MRILLIVLVICGLASCASVQPMAPTVVTAPEHKVDRNYELGKSQQVYVGQPLVRVRDYYEQQTQIQMLRANQAFKMSTGFLGPSANVAQGEGLRVVGSTDHRGKTYRVVHFQDPGLFGFNFLINPDGTFSGLAISSITGVYQMGTLLPEPSDVKLLGDMTTLVDKTKGYMNFELVYDGTTGDSIQVLYREYTPDDMARPAFSQQLVYSLISKHIRFRDIQVDVATADNEHIVYRCGRWFGRNTTLTNCRA